ncbi:MAG: hypothetical protein ACD_56C00116G0008 [uncultured bacterium]|nr:MAG: hypothetical protein ACD_56C00116G0008 [uncultured bacterium]
MASLLIPSILLMGVQKVYAATGTLIMNNFQVSVESSAVVPISVNVTDGSVNDFSVSITYSENVVDVLTDADIILNPAFTGAVIADAGEGITTITASAVAPMAGIVNLANVRFSPTGTSGMTSTVTVTPAGFTDELSNPFVPEPTPISVTATLADTTPDPFSFPNQSNVPLSTPIDSAPILITGIDVPTSISINNGAEYSINQGAFTSAPGTVVSNDSVVVRLMSSGSYSTVTTTFLRVGTGGDDFRVTTISDPAIDTAPDAFTFINQTNAPLSSPIDSAPIIVSGINVPAPISVTGGEYAINGGAFTSAQGTVENGNSVVVRVLSSSNFLTQTSAVLNIGGIGDDFRVTTLALDVTPDAFAFADQVDVALGSPITSDPITVTGINSPAAISIVGGEYEINGSGTFTSEAGTVENGNTVVVRVTSSASFSTPTDATLSISGVSDVFSATTLADPTDAIPDQFTFTDLVDVALASLVSSDPITVAGINSPTAISIIGGEYEINGSGTFTAETGTVNAGDIVIVRINSAGTFSTPTDANLTIGGVSDIFTVTTLADVSDTTPDAFVFTDLTDVELNTQATSNAIIVSGIGSPTAISIVGGEYEINESGTFTSEAGTVENGDTVIVRLNSSADYSTPVDATLTIGGVSDTFTATTLPAPDTTPEQFTFTDLVDVALALLVSSDPIAVAGINSPTAISIVGGEYEINGSGTFTSEAGTVENGDTVIIRMTSSENFSTPVSATLTVGGVSDEFNVITLADPSDATPDAFAFEDQTDIALNTIIESGAITVSGINVSVPVSIVGGEYSINGSPFTSTDGTVANGDAVIVRLLSSSDFSTTTSATLNINGVSDEFSVTTVGAPANNAPSLQSMDIATQNVLVGSTVNFTAAASDPNGDALSFSLSSNAPAGATIDANTGVFSWTPTATGTFSFDVIVSDAALSDSENITITVSETPQVPEPQNPSPVIQTVFTADDDDCGDTCEKYKEFKRKYKNDEARNIYKTLKEMKKSDSASFLALESTYKTYRDLSDGEIKKLDPRIQSQFKLFKSYNGYKHYRNLKERVD